MEFSYIYTKKEIVWIVDDTHIWAAEIEENRDYFCMVFLYGNTSYNTQHVGLGLTYIYPYDFNQVEIEASVADRLKSFQSSNCTSAKWACEQNEIFQESQTETYAVVLFQDKQFGI